MDENAVLTPRQSQICDLLIQGCANKEVADELSIKEKTADNHIQKIKKKYGVSKTSEVVVLYMKKKFNLSMDLTVMQRRNRALVLILILVTTEVFSFTDYCKFRCQRGKRVRTEIRHKLKSRENV